MHNRDCPSGRPSSSAPSQALIALARTKISLLLLVLLGASCGSSTETSTSPSPVRCGVQAQTETSTFAPDGGSGTIRVSTNRECSWAAQSDAAWLSLVAPAQGQGDGTVQFTVASNGDPGSRNTAVRVEDQRLQVSQEGRPCSFRLSSTIETVEASGGDRTIQVTASSAQCRWTSTAEDPWITILTGSEGNGDGAVSIRVAAVNGPQRTGSVTVAGQRVQIDQGTGCAFSIAVTTFSFGADGGAGNVPVTAPPGCSWTAQTQTPWITLTTTSGSGPANVGFRVADTDGPARTGTIVVAGRVATITQSPGCTFVVEPATHSVAPGGGTATTHVRTAAGCAWSASSAADWIVVTTGQGGSGPGEVQFTSAANTGPARSGRLTIAGHQVTVNQGSGCNVTVTPRTVNASAAATNGALQVATAAGCTWSATSSAPWVSLGDVSSGSGNGQVAYTIQANTGPARQASISIAGIAVSIAQASGCTYSVTPPVQDVSGAGGNATASITTATGCPWTASTTSDWISIPTRSGSGATQLALTVAANPGPPRSATVTVAEQTLTINQASPCLWTMVPPSHAFGAGGGNGNVLVIVVGNCTWTAVSNADWITLTAGASGAGNGLVQFVAAPNNGPARTGTLTIAGQRYDVTQAGR